MAYSDVFFVTFERHNRVIAIGLLQRFEKRHYIVLFSGVQKLLVMFYKTSLNNITFSYIILENTFSDVYKTPQIIRPIATFQKRHKSIFLLLFSDVFKTSQNLLIIFF